MYDGFSKITVRPHKENQSKGQLMEAQQVAQPRLAAGGTLKEDLTARATTVAAVAASHANAVDSASRFPAEAFQAVKAQRLLGIQVPKALGGEGAGIGDVADVCYQLGQACGSTGMIFAMHQIKVACIMRHMGENATLQRMLRRLCAEQLLLASSTTEGQGGGNIRSSEAPIEQQEVLVAFFKSDYTLTRLQGWDALGMRGTCSEGYTLKAAASAEQVLPEPYENIHTRTMVPFAHLLWGSVWTGIAASATARAQGFVRNAMRHSGQLPPGAPQFTRALASLRTLRGMLTNSLRRYEQCMNDPQALAALDFQTLITLTKVEASELAAQTVMHAMRACGLSGYRNDSEYSIGRHLRDVLSSPIMINNDRILANLATPVLMSPMATSLRD